MGSHCWRHAPTPSMPLIEQCIGPVVPVDATKRQRGVGGVTGRGQPGKRRWALVNWLPRGGGWIGESCRVMFVFHAAFLFFVRRRF